MADGPIQKLFVPFVDRLTSVRSFGSVEVNPESIAHLVKHVWVV